MITDANYIIKHIADNDPMEWDYYSGNTYCYYCSNNEDEDHESDCIYILAKEYVKNDI